MLAKKRAPAMPENNKKLIIGSLRCVDEVVISSDLHPVFDFETHVRNIRPNILAVTEDDKHIAVKREFCEKYGMKFVVLRKRNVVDRVSTTSILSSIKNTLKVPLRVDFAGGWLDVPKFSKKGGYIVNCAISPLVSLEDWPYKKGAGLGGSAAFAILKAAQGVRSEIDMGVGWQDPAIINHTGLCVWRSGKKPVLDAQYNPDWLVGKMLIYWTGNDHVSANIVDLKRDLGLVYKAGSIAREAVRKENMKMLANAVSASYKMQLGEGMKPLPAIKRSLAHKYLGAGHGGYALYLFSSKAARDAALKKVKGTTKIEPYIKDISK